MSAIKIGVIRGGPSAEHEISLKTGENIISFLREKYLPADIVLTKSGEWIFEKHYSSPEKIFRFVDVVFNALRGNFGEDGKVQKLMDLFNVPYTGSGAFASALGMNKILSRDVFARAGLKIPRAEIVGIDEPAVRAASRIMKKIVPPWVIKPVSSGSSIGVSVARSFPEMVQFIENAFNFSPKIIVEEYIKGREAACGVIDDFRGEKHYSLPVIEIISPASSRFFDYEAKYGGQAKKKCPANIDLNTKKAIEEMARRAHKFLGCRHYSCADFIVSPRGIYILEANTLPSLDENSPLREALNAVGSSYGEFFDHLIALALKKSRA